MMERSVRGFELAMWAIWLGALWFMAILVAPGLFKWLARADAGLVAGRLFVMLSWYSVGATVLLALLSNAGSALPTPSPSPSASAATVTRAMS